MSDVAPARLWMLDVLHPKKKRSQFKEQVVVIATSPAQAREIYQKHLDGLEVDFPKAPKSQIIRVAPYGGLWVSRGVFKYSSPSLDIR